MRLTEFKFPLIKETIKGLHQPSEQEGVINGAEFKTAFSDVLVGVYSLFRQVEKDQQNDFLICILDLINITYRPDAPPLSFTLAGNPDYFINHLPDKPFKIKCFTQTSTNDQQLYDLWNVNNVSEILDLENADQIFILISAEMNLEQEFVVGALDFFDVDFGGEQNARTLAGFGYDTSLEDSYRVSVLAFFIQDE